jgi:hypothetical protein
VTLISKEVDSMQTETHAFAVAKREVQMCPAQMARR